MNNVMNNMHGILFMPHQNNIIFFILNTNYPAASTNHRQAVIGKNIKFNDIH